MSIDDQEAFAAVLPSERLFATQFDFYLHVSDLFKAALSTYHDVSFTQLALSVAAPALDTTALWHNVIKGLTDLGQYEDAYTALISAPYERLYVYLLDRVWFCSLQGLTGLFRKSDCVGPLVYRMCEENACDRLMALNFAGLADEVEGALAFKARNADPRIRPFYSRILYTWYVSRGDYRSGESALCHGGDSSGVNGGIAALTIYQRARKLEAAMGDATAFAELAELQLEAYVVAMNSLALVDPKSQWITLPITTESKHEVSGLSHLGWKLYSIIYLKAPQTPQTG